MAYYRESACKSCGHMSIYTPPMTKSTEKTVRFLCGWQGLPKGYMPRPGECPHYTPRVANSEAVEEA